MESKRMRDASIRDNLAVYDSLFVLVISCACLG